MRKFEYKIIDSKDVASAGVFKGRQRADVEAYLCTLGEDGWEIINMDSGNLKADSNFPVSQKERSMHNH